MSSIGYRGLLYEVSQTLKDLSKINKLLYTTRSEGFIAEDSESYNAQVNPGDNFAVITTQLFSDLEKQDHLGIDNLEILRDLLKGVKEWSLVDKVDKFERQRMDFITLLDKFIAKLDELDKLDELISLCADHIPEDVKSEIKDLRSLFRELEKKKRLGFERLAILKKILNEAREQELLDETKEKELLDALLAFKKKWKEEENAERRRDWAADAVNTVVVAPAVGLYSAVKHSGEQLIGALKAFCKFSTVSGISLAVGTGIILRQGSRASLREFVDAFKEAVLPAATELRALSESSVCFTIQAENMPALKALWDQYQDGTLQRNLQQFLVTDDIRQLANREEVIVSVQIDEQVFNDACLSLIIAENQDLQKDDPGTPTKRARRNSDSFLHMRSQENEATLFYSKLRRAETKFHKEKIESLEKENENLRAQIEETSGLASPSKKATGGSYEVETHLFGRRKREIQEGPEQKRTKPAAISDLEIEEIRGLESPRKRRRRNSDSELYCKTRDEVIREREMERERFLGEEKYAFVQRYLENVHETHSITTLTSDSGIKTHGAPSELGTGDMSDDTHTVFFRDLSADVISEVTNRIEADHRAPRDILQSFGITGYYRGFRGIFKLFPDTPVKLLRDVCEVLQLYDLVDLLQKPVQPKPHVTKSLRPVLTLDEVRELGKSDARPISYHSRAAVLIFVESENDSNVKSYESFFKSLNNNSEVIIIQCDGIMKLMKERRELQFRPLADATARFRGIPSWYTQKRLEKELAEIKAKQRKEEENVETAASTVVDRWIQHQDEFSFFAVFSFWPVSFSADVISKLSSGIPYKTKLVFGQWAEEGLSETLQVNTFSDRKLLTLLVDILKKRWQILDLVRMLDECDRSFYIMSPWFRIPIHSLTITDTLSSLPRFRQEKD